MTIQDLKEQGLILLECISGSRAYGLDLPGSDLDIKGVFYLPKEQFLGFNYVPQVSNDSHDVVYYELGRFMELMSKSNPNILELLATPENKVLLKHPLIDQIKPEFFLSKRCKDSFGGYAFAQIKKARGLNKKIVNPLDRKKKTILDFCYVLSGQGSIPVEEWLASHALDQKDCGLINLPHAQGMHGIFVDRTGKLAYRGMTRTEQATSLLLSSIPKEEPVAGYLYFNQDGYIRYCKDYKAYWEWVENRNEPRYQQNVDHGKNYDSKNMMHTFRLLNMAIEILKTGRVQVWRADREDLLKIRRGEYAFEELIQMADEKMQAIEAAHAASLLPDQVDEAQIERLLVSLRKQLYE
ncbi:MAG: nucleotidyltransferase domain-containing protein [Bacteroidota bacterium]